MEVSITPRCAPLPQHFPMSQIELAGARQIGLAKGGRFTSTTVLARKGSLAPTEKLGDSTEDRTTIDQATSVSLLDAALSVGDEGIVGGWGSQLQERAEGTGGSGALKSFASAALIVIDKGQIAHGGIII